MERPISDKGIDISVVVVAYNPDWKQMKSTLESVIKQKEISYEIIIADDGSKDNLKGKLSEFFNERQFSNYKFVLNSENRGTVCNLMSGLEVAEGEYIKDISPGDELYTETALRDSLKYMKDNGYVWSFSEAIYYSEVDGDGRKKIISGEAFPNDISPYKKGNVLKARWNYVVLGDFALGATMLCKTKTQYDYCKKIVNRVKYAEDNIWRMMMFDGVEFGYYPYVTMLYEYGTGVSTSGNDKWARRLKDDLNATDEIMFARPLDEMDSFQSKMLKMKKWNDNKFLKIFVKGKIKSVLLRKCKRRMTSCI